MYLQLVAAAGVKRSPCEIDVHCSVFRSLNVKARVIRCFFEPKDTLMIYQNKGFPLFYQILANIVLSANIISSANMKKNILGIGQSRSKFSMLGTFLGGTKLNKKILLQKC